MRAVPAAVARMFFEEAVRMEEQSRRMQEQIARKPAPGGIRRPENADPTMTAYEVMLAADADTPDPNKRLTRPRSSSRSVSGLRARSR